MANKRISDLVAATTLFKPTGLFEQASPGVESLKVTQDQVRSAIMGLRDDMMIEHFDDYAVGAITAFDAGIGMPVAGVGSGASIISATMADARVHNRLALNNGVYGRKMPWGALWNRIKIVIAARINNGANFLNTNGYIGVCSGTTNMVNVATCANFVGVRWGDGTGTSTFTAGTKINFFDVPSFRGVTVRTGPVITDRGGLSSGHSVSADAGYLSYIIVEMSRPVFANDAASVNYSVAEDSMNSVAVQFSYSKDGARALAQDGDLVITSLANSGTDVAILQASGVTAAAFAFDQSVGALDTINLYWPQAFNLEIAEIAVRKIR
jgi:hypothetical protein